MNGRLGLDSEVVNDSLESDTWTGSCWCGSDEAESGGGCGDPVLTAPSASQRHKCTP